MTAPTLDIVIVNYNTCADLDACLRSLAAAPPAGRRTTWVVDNASTDGSQAHVASQWPAVSLIALPDNRGFAAANNVALRRSTSDLALLLNSDTLVPPGAIDQLVERLQSTSATAAGPRLVDAAGQPEVSFGRMLSPIVEAGQMLRGRAAASSNGLVRAYVRRLTSRERFVDWVSGACLLVRRNAAVAAGLLDERYFMYEEDVDFCAELRARGGRILFAPSAEITHLRGRSIQRAAGRSTAIYDRSHVAFYEKHLPRWAPALRAWLRVRGRHVTSA